MTNNEYFNNFMDSQKKKYNEKMSAINGLSKSLNMAEAKTAVLPALDIIAFAKKAAILDSNPEMFSAELHDANDYKRYLNDIITVYRQASELSDKITALYVYQKNAEAVNAWLAEREFFPDDYKIAPIFSSDVNCIMNDFFAAKKVLENIASERFKTKVLIAAINELDVANIEELRNAHYYDDIDLSDVAPTEKNAANLALFSQSKEDKTETFSTRLKGVSFPNSDGSSRQEFLKELQATPYTMTEKPHLDIVPYIYTDPETGSTSPAARVLWGNKEIGNLSATLVANINAAYSSPVYSAELEKVMGDVTSGPLGCSIKLTVSEKTIALEEKNSFFSSLIKKSEKKEEQTQPEQTPVPEPVKEQEEEPEEIPFN